MSWRRVFRQLEKHSSDTVRPSAKKWTVSRHSLTGHLSDRWQGHLQLYVPDGNSAPLSVTIRTGSSCFRTGSSLVSCAYITGRPLGSIPASVSEHVFPAAAAAAAAAQCIGRTPGLPCGSIPQCSALPTSCHPFFATSLVGTSKAAVYGGTSSHAWRASPQPQLLAQRSLWSWLKRQSPPAAPVPEPRPVRRRAHGLEWVDEYSWMERGGPEVDAHLRRELEHAAAFLADTAELQEKLRAEMLSWLPDSLATPPEKLGGYEYWSRQTADATLPCYLRRRLPDGPDEVLLDLNALMAQHGTAGVGQMKLSPSGNMLAYTLEAGEPGCERYAGCVRDLRAGSSGDRQVLESAVSLEWFGDEETLLYTLPDALGRPSKVMRGGISKGGSAAACLFEERDERFFVEIGHTKDSAFLTINSNSKTSSEVHLVDARNPTAAPRCVQPRQAGLEYFVEHCGGRLLILSNAGATAGYRLFQAPVESPQLQHWQVIIPERPGIAIEDMDVFDGRCVLYERRSGLPGASLLTLDACPAWPDSLEGPTSSSSSSISSSAVKPTLLQQGAMNEVASSGVNDTSPASGSSSSDNNRSSSNSSQTSSLGFAGSLRAGASSQHVSSLKELQLPVWCTALTPGMNADFHGDTVTITCECPTKPPTTCTYSLAAGELVAVEASPQADGPSLGLEDYVSRRVWATSADGTQVPITISHAGELKRDGSAPLLLHVYGAYGQSAEVGYEPEKLCLLQRGWVLATAHVRGGGEFGRRWHQEGRTRLKMNSVMDLEACLTALIDQGYSRAGRVALEGMSSAGVLLGALLNRQPMLIGAVVARVPFVDLLTAMLSPQLPLTAHEYGEWGDPHDAEDLSVMQEVCPYHNILPQGAHFPPVLATCSLMDTRVPFWGPAKWIARLRRAQRGNAPLLLLPNDEGGHFGVESDALTDRAREYAFLMKAMRLTDPQDR